MWCEDDDQLRLILIPGREQIFENRAFAERSNSPEETTRLTNPHSAAVSALIGFPVSSISRARFRPIARVSATIGVEQNSPIFTPGVANVASLEAITKSHEATNWHPAAVAIPCTRATTGWGIL